MLSARPTLNDVVGALLAAIGLGVLSWLAVVAESEQAEGAIIALLAAAVSWLYRGRVQPPDGDEPAPPEGRRTP